MDHYLIALMGVHLTATFARPQARMPYQTLKEVAYTSQVQILSLEQFS